MNRSEFIVAIAAILFVTFALGWAAGWLVNRFARRTTADLGELDRMAREVHEAEETRDQALAFLNDREAELQSRIGELEAELDAAMGGLRHARAEVEDLRARVS